MAPGTGFVTNPDEELAAALFLRERSGRALHWCKAATGHDVRAASQAIGNWSIRNGERRAMSLSSRMSVLVTLLLAVPPLSAASAKERLIWEQANANPQFRLYLSDPGGNDERPFLPGPESNYNPSFSTDGQWIIFTSERFGSADIFRAHPDGSGLERLTDSPAMEDQGALSPDGRQLAFVSTRNGGKANIWLLEIGKKARAFNLTKSQGGNFRPSWSPDGKWIAFSSDRETHRMRYLRGASPAWELMQTTAIYIVHPDASGLRRLTPLQGSAGSPKWSRDGRRVLFEQIADMNEMREFRSRTEIVSIDIGTGAREVHTDGTKYVWCPSYVSDNEIGYGLGGPTERTVSEAGKLYFVGTSVAYSSGRKGPTGAENPSWSPDGSFLVYDRNTPIKQSWIEVSKSRDPRYELIGGEAFRLPSVTFTPDGRHFIYTSEQQINMAGWDGPGSHVIFDGSPNDRVLGTGVELSADGQTLAFGIRSSKYPEEAGKVAVVNSDGSHFRVVATQHDGPGFSSLSPDGKKIVFSDSVQHPVRVEEGLRIASLSDGKTTRLTNGWDNTPVWSPLGDRIAFTGFETGDFEIYTIRPNGTGLRQLTHTHGNDSHPVWSPDGKWIAFLSSRMGWKDESLLPWHGPQTYGEIFVMRSDGTEVRQVTDNQWEELVLAWAPPAPD
jgi:TolB protein